MTDQQRGETEYVQPTPIVWDETPPGPTEELEREADAAIRFLERFTTNARLDAELRIGFNDVRSTLKNLKSTVKRQSSEAKEAHERMVEILKSNTPNRRRD